MGRSIVNFVIKLYEFYKENTDWKQNSLNKKHVLVFFLIAVAMVVR